MASSSSTSTQDLYAKWTSLSDEELTLNDVEQYLSPITDDLWVSAACVDRLLEDVLLQKSLLELGLKRTESALRRSRKVYEDPSARGSDGDDSVPSSSELTEEQRRSSALALYYVDEPADAQLCHLRTMFLDRLDRLEAYIQISKEMPEEDSEEDIDEEWEDDPWADEKLTSTETRRLSKPPLPLSSFLVDDLLLLACHFASMEYFPAVRTLFERFDITLWPYRFAILESIPEHTSASEYREILPGINSRGDFEQKFASVPCRSELDWSEQPEIREAISESRVPLKPLYVSETPNWPSHPVVLSSDDLSSWYRDRTDAILAGGLVDVALSLIQHAASQGVANLDEIGEELSLLSRLVYDTPLAEYGKHNEDWTLSRWKSLIPTEVIRAYLAHSSPETIVNDIHKLVMPYLFVLESRAERAGNPDPALPNRLLYEYILNAPLELVAAIFEGSKPTLPPAQRLIKDDEDMARLALACLYGSDSLDKWPMMSRIFECLPAWDTPEEGNERDEVDTTIASLGTFVTPSTARPRCTPTDLLLFFKPLPFSSLSRALDVLDVHLESGEILARWRVPAPLRWFLQSNGSISEQRSWANRMARRAGGAEDKLSSQDDWEWLLEDMLKLAGSGESGLRGAFCLLTKDDVIQIFFGGVLAASRFDVAKSLLHSRKGMVHLAPDIVEEICLTISQEFYDNASSGNYHFGDMKLAYDCLEVARPSERIRQQKEFIEATSRLCSFNLTSRPGIPISPIEIRLTKDRLSLVSRVLSSNPDAYKHTQVILDLVNMLGFRGDAAAEVKALAMLADTALQAEDFKRAYETSERMVAAVLDFKTLTPFGVDDPKVQEANEVCWVACYQLGRQHEFTDVQKKLTLLARALELCPPDKLIDVLTARRRLEQDDMEERQARLISRRRGTPRDYTSHKHSSNTHGVTFSLASRLQSLNMPNLNIASSPMSLSHAPDPAALAEKAFRAAASFSFSDFSARGRSLISEATRDRSSSRDGSRSRYDEYGQQDAGAEVSAQAQKVLSKGLGWLLGDDD